MKTKRQREKAKRAYTSAKKWVEKQESGGGSTAWDLPDGMSFYKWKKGLNRLDFIPFVVGNGNPNAEPGEVHWEREYRVHQIPGPARRVSLNCLTETFGKNRCAACEMCAAQLKAGTDSDEVKKLEGKKRHGAFVIDLDEKDKGIQFLEFPHYKSFGEMMKDELESAPDDSDILDFYHLSNGMTVHVMCKEDSHEGRKYMKPFKVTFEKRKKQYKESMLDDVPCLDDLLIELSYKDMKAKIGAVEEEDEDDDEEDTKKRKKGKKVVDEDEEDDDGEEEDDEGDDDEDGEEDDADEDEGDDEDDDDGEDEDEEGEEDDDDSVIVKGSEVRSKKKHKGEYRTGTVKKVNTETGLAKIEDEDGEVWAENVKNLVEVEDDVPFDDDDEDDEDEDEKPKKKKRKK